MSEETVVETKTEEPKAGGTADNAGPAKGLGIADVISKSKETVETEPVVETPVVKAVETPKEEPKETPKVETPDSEGLLKAVQAERKRRQELQLQLAELQKSVSVPTEQVEPMRDPLVKKQIAQIAEDAVRAVKPDFDEKFREFSAAVFDGEQPNMALYDQVMSSPNPALAAYDMGKQIQFNKKYGFSLDEQVTGLKKEWETSEREKIRKEVEAELKGKLITKESQPTNLLSTRSAGDASHVPFVQPGMGDILGARRRR